MSLGFVDQVVVARLGDDAVATVAITNQVMFVVAGVFGTLSGAVGILVSQLHGKRETEATSSVVTTTSLAAACLGVLACAALIAFARPILDIFHLAAASKGVSFYRIMATSLPFMLVSAVASAALCALSDTRTSMAITLVSVCINAALNIVLVFGLLFFPRMGVDGAAVATLSAQIFRAGALVYAVFVRRDDVGFRLPETLAALRTTFAKVLGVTAPLAAGQILWVLGGFTYTFMFSRLGEAELVANQINNTMECIFIYCSSGFSAAGLALVGQSIGASELAVARTRARAIMMLGLGASATFGLVLASLALVVRVFFPGISDQALALAKLGIVVNALFQPVKVTNMILGGGILTSGNDTKFLALNGIFTVYMVGVPVALFCGFYLHLGLIGIYIGRLAEETARVITLLARYRTPKWHHVLAP